METQDKPACPENDLELNHLSPNEYAKICNVLKRDRELRTAEEVRIKELRDELTCLRKGSALRPGVSTDRSCARCLQVLGRIINRGALCAFCLKKVCKSCRRYGAQENHQWLCIYCNKQMELKAVSGEWMHEFNRTSIRRRGNAPPGEQLRRALHETQRRSLMSFEREDSVVAAPSIRSVENAPPKPSRNFARQPHATIPCASDDVHSDNEMSENIPTPPDIPPIVKAKAKAQKSGSAPGGECIRSPRPLPRVSPWSGIEAEPSIPVRSARAASFGHLMSADCGDPWMFRERYSSDDTHSTVSFRSQSTSSEVTDEADTTASTPLAKRKAGPLKKQQAIIEAVVTENQSSVDTTDSGVYSPVANASNQNCLPSPMELTSRPKFGQQKSALKTDASCSDTASEGSSSQVVKKVVFKKKRSLHKKEESRKVIHPPLERVYSMSADESGNSLRSSPHGRMRIRHRTLSGGSEDDRHIKVESLPQIAVSGCTPPHPGLLSATSSEKDSIGGQDEDVDQVFAYHSRSQMSLSSFGGRSGSVTSVYSAAGGGRYGTVTVTGDVLFSLSYSYKTSTFEVMVKECRNLAAVDAKRNRSDPYVKIYLLPDRTKSGKRKTKVKKHTLNPLFDELLKFQVTISELERRTLWLSVWHSDRFGRNDFLGEVMMTLVHDSIRNSDLQWHPLQERLEMLDCPVSYKGDLILALKYVPPDVTSRRPAKKPGNQPKGSLHVLIKEARNLMATRSNGTSDPFCKSYLLPDKTKGGKQKTAVLKKTCSPKWNHTFVYEDLTIDELRERCMELTIWDYDKITSNDFLGGVRLCLGSGKQQGNEVDWMDSIGEEVSLWYTMLDRPNMWVDGSLLLRPTMQNRKMP